MNFPSLRATLLLFTTTAKLHDLINHAAELPPDLRAELLQALIEMDPRYADIHHADELERTPLIDSAAR